MITPAYGARTIHVTKEVGVPKELLAKALEDPKSYREVFPTLVKDVKINSNDKNQIKFVIDAMGTRETDVKLSSSGGAFVVEILSGDLKGSKIKTTLKERVGFDGTPGGATTVKCTLDLEVGFMASMAMAMVGNSQIETEVGNGFYKLGEYVKSKYPQNNLVNVDYKKNTPKLEAAKKLDPQKEVKKTQVQTIAKKETKKIQTIAEKREAAKKLVERRQAEASKEPVLRPKSLPLYNSIKLHTFPATISIGDVVVFSGELQLAGTNPAGATVYIKDEDPIGGDDLMASGTVDSSGKFSIRWVAKNMDADSIADVYAVFEGTDIHPRLTTCGSGCSNTVSLATR